MTLKTCSSSEPLKSFFLIIIESLKLQIDLKFCISFDACAYYFEIKLIISFVLSVNVACRSHQKNDDRKKAEKFHVQKI
jgi:hypothetical protein